MKRKSGGERQCVHCGQPATTKDHIPPRGLFPKPRPDLITVPSCADCNEGASLDDEYFRFIVSQVGEGPHSPAADRVRETVERSLASPERKRFLAMLREQISRDGNGRFEFETFLPRMARVAQRVVTGLFFHHKRYRVPDDFDAIVWIDDEYFLLGLKMPVFFEHHLGRVPWIDVGDGDVFRYRLIFPDPEIQDNSVWEFEFYRAYMVRALTRRRKGEAVSRPSLRFVPRRD